MKSQGTLTSQACAQQHVPNPESAFIHGWIEFDVVSLALLGCMCQGRPRIDLWFLDKVLTKIISKCSLMTILLQRTKIFEHPKVSGVLWNSPFLYLLPGLILKES